MSIMETLPQEGPSAAAMIAGRNETEKTGWPSDQELTAVFQALCKKYSVAFPANWRLSGKGDSGNQGEVLLVPAGRTCGNECVPLFYWRQERRFVELKKLVSTRTIEDVVMCRFSCTGSRSGESLTQIMFREYDLLEWINDSRIKDLYATMYDSVFANVVATIASGAVCSIETGSTLPRSQNNEFLDRHELIARRGVASDRVVDSQIPQQSIYLYKESERQTWTDCDAELFGMPMNAIYFVRAAFELAKRINNDPVREKEEFTVLRKRAQRLDRLVTATFNGAQSGTVVVDREDQEDGEVVANGSHKERGGV